ncbi:hypothetical protein ATKI12_8302 [Kitasatospora sp. Ki12]|uniref:RICIN domain-containing protein n=1 Tax=Kitasatospora xanthocidica TaxID=83382 RepID=UPI00199D8C20|nr:RICIN domain-containing protein [Kitasatospora xanthocidica]GHF88737.1 hypothetical protein GCM10018790_77710 [Kitasatospora xanthocidica]
MRKQICTGLGILALVTAALGAGAGSASAATGGPSAKPAAVRGLAALNYVGQYRFHSNYNGKCLDADLNTIGANGTKVQLWDCNGWTNQNWTIWTDGNIDYIQSNYSGRYLDADLNTIGANGTKVQLWDFNGWTNQRWNAASYGWVNGYNGRVLDADLNTIGANGTKVQLWDSNSWSNQGWWLEAI